MKTLIIASVALLSSGVVAQAQAQAGKNLTWAYPIPDKAPPGTGDAGPKKIPGSTRSFTQVQIDDQFNPPDWFPDEHGPLPKVVKTGIQAQACGSCHLMSGLGHPESANLAGLPVAYMIRQMDDFKSGVRKDPMMHEQSARAARMNIIASGLPEEDMHKAVEWFAISPSRRSGTRWRKRRRCPRAGSTGAACGCLCQGAGRSRWGIALSRCLRTRPE